MANLLSSSDLEEIRSTIDEIVKDTSINTTIKYRQYTGEDYYNPRDQRILYERTDWSGVSALRGLVTQKETEMMSGIEVGDAKFVIMRSSVSNTLSVSDLIVDSGVSYNIKSVAYDPLELVYILYASAV
jgi:hypothetical protein